MISADYASNGPVAGSRLATALQKAVPKAQTLAAAGLLPCAEPDTAGDNDEDDNDDDTSSGSSVNDVPTDRELDRMIAAQEAHRARQQQLAGQQEQQQAPKPGGPGAADGPLQMQRQGEQQQTQLLPAKHGGR